MLDNADYFDTMAVHGKRPILALEIAVEEVFSTDRPGRERCGHPRYADAANPPALVAMSIV